MNVQRFLFGGEVEEFIANGKSTLDYVFDMIKRKGVRKTFLTDTDLFHYLLGTIFIRGI